MDFEKYAIQSMLYNNYNYGTGGDKYTKGSKKNKQKAKAKRRAVKKARKRNRK